MPNKFLNVLKYGSGSAARWARKNPSTAVAGGGISAAIGTALAHNPLEVATGAGLHLAQNIAMKHAILPSERFGKRVGEAFAEGFHNVHDASLSRRAKDLATAALMPDMNVITGEARSAGAQAAKIYNNMSLRQQAAAKAAHAVLTKHGPELRALERFKKPTSGLVTTQGPSRTLAEALYRAGNVSRVARSKDHPLLSNLGKNILHAKLTPGKEYALGSGYKQDQAMAFLGAIPAAAIDPAAGAISLSKALIGNERANESIKAIKDVSRSTARSYREAFDRPNDPHNRFSDRISEYLGSPLMVAPKRTASALSAALSGITPNVK
jgi:hypothetical protein